MKIKRFWLLLLAVTLLFIFSSCGGTAIDDVSGDTPSISYNKANPDVTDGDTAAKDRKLIKTVNLGVQTTDYDGYLAALRAGMEQIGAYTVKEVEGNSTRSGNRTISLTVMVPAASMDDFTATLRDGVDVLEYNATVDDVTTAYADVLARRDTLADTIEQMNALFARCTTVEQTVSLMEEVDKLKQEYNSLVAQLATYDTKISCSTLYLTVWEVEVYKPVPRPSAWVRMGDRFMDSLATIGENATDFAVWFVGNLPHLVLWAGIITGLYFLIRRIKRSKKK